MTEVFKDFQQLKSIFLDSLAQQEKSFNTIKNYKNDLDCFIKFLQTQQGHTDFKHFNSESVAAYENYINHKYSAENSKRRRIQALRLFFDFLVKKEFFPENPIKKVAPAPKILNTPSPPRPVIVEQFYDVLTKECQSDKINIKALVAERNRLIFLLIYHAALRVSDIAAIQTNDILLSDHQIRLLIKPAKRDAYTIPLPDYFENYLKHYQLALEQVRELTDQNFSHLFFYANAYKIISGSLSPRGIELLFKEISKKTGQKMTPRSLRQAAILKWFAQGHSETTIKEWLGVAPNYSLKMYREYFQQFQGECLYPSLE